MIRWIHSNLGTASGKDSELFPYGAFVVDTRELVDGPGNNLGEVKRRIEEGSAALLEGRRVVVCCDHGISRSNAIAAGILCRSGWGDFRTCVSKVVSETAEGEIKIDMINVVRDALGFRPLPPSVGSQNRILVTGAHGFIGNHLCARLEQENRLLRISKTEADLEKGGLQLELIVEEFCPDVLVHLAAPAVINSSRSFGLAHTILRNVLDVCARHCIHLVFPSTVDVFSGYPDHSTLDEFARLRPTSIFGETKASCERVIDDWRRTHGITCTIVRSAAVIGGRPVRPRFLARFMDLARQGRVITTHEYENGPARVQLLHVDDWCEGIRHVLERREDGVIHFTGGRIASTFEIAKAVVDASGTQSEINTAKLQGERRLVTLSHNPKFAKVECFAADHLNMKEFLAEEFNYDRSDEN